MTLWGIASAIDAMFSMRGLGFVLIGLIGVLTGCGTKIVQGSVTLFTNYNINPLPIYFLGTSALAEVPNGVTTLSRKRYVLGIIKSFMPV